VPLIDFSYDADGYIYGAQQGMYGSGVSSVVRY